MSTERAGAVVAGAPWRRGGVYYRTVYYMYASLAWLGERAVGELNHQQYIEYNLIGHTNRQMRVFHLACSSESFSTVRAVKLAILRDTFITRRESRQRQPIRHCSFEPAVMLCRNQHRSAGARQPNQPRPRTANPTGNLPRTEPRAAPPTRPGSRRMDGARWRMGVVA